MDAAPLSIPAGAVTLPARLSLPPAPRGLVVFVHGSGSSRFSPRNQAVALQAAAARPEAVAAVVSRGGRPDLAGEALASVLAPTLLIVGGEDGELLRLNREAAARLHGLHRLEVIAGAGHLFEEPGPLERAARLACHWFLCHLAASSSSAGLGQGLTAPLDHGPIRAGHRLFRDLD